MTNEEFVKRVRKAVYETAIEGTLSLLEKPPGRRPSEDLSGLSRWFRQLSDDDSKYIRAIIELAVRGAIFGMLAVLDGVRSIREAGESAGTLELRYIAGGQSFLLNDPADHPLHDLLGAIPEDSGGNGVNS